MPLIAGNRTIYWNDLIPENYSKTINIIKMLPMPEVRSRINIDINNANTLICLQRETCYVDTSIDREYQFLGTKYAHTCFLVHIYTGSHHYVAHIDYATQFNIEEFIKKSQSKSISISIAGGTEDSISSTTMICLLKELYRIAEKFEIDIHIVRQIVMGNNLPNQETTNEFFYDKIIGKADLLCRQHYKHPLPQSVINKKEFNDFQTKNTSKNFDDLLLFTALIYGTNYCYEAETILQKNFELVKTKFLDNKESFYGWVDALFSHEGYKAMLSFYDNPKNNSMPKAKLNCFAFNLRDDSIITVSDNIYTEKEAERIFFSITNSNYHFYYQTKLGKIINEIDNKTLELFNGIIASQKNNLEKFLIDKEIVIKQMSSKFPNINNSKEFLKLTYRILYNLYLEQKFRQHAAEANVKKIKECISLGIDPNAVPLLGTQRTALHWIVDKWDQAQTNNYIEGLRFLAGISNLGKEDKNGETALQLAINKNNLVAVKILLEFSPPTMKIKFNDTTHQEIKDLINPNQATEKATPISFKL